MNTQEYKAALAHVLWLGGATDSGKTTIANTLGERYNLPVYNYDRYDLAHHEKLAQTSEKTRRFMNASIDERWVAPDPAELLQRTLESFSDCWPLVLAELLALPRDQPVIAEGFGLTPDLVAPLLTNPRQAIWLVSNLEFKTASMARRNKPSFGAQASDPQRAYNNLLQRDMMLADVFRRQAQAHGLNVQEVDGSRSIEAMVLLIDRYFGLRKRFAGALPTIS